MFPLEQFQLEDGQSMFSERIAPLVRLRKEVWTMWNREHVLSGRGLARRPLSARRVHVKMTSHVAQCIHNKSYCADRVTEMCADFKSERRGTENISRCSQSERSCTKNLFREHFAGVVYREHIWTGPLAPMYIYIYPDSYQFSPIIKILMCFSFQDRVRKSCSWLSKRK